MVVRRGWVLVAVLGLVVAAAARAGELVGVPGSSVQYPATIVVQTTGGAVEMGLTGTALRKKFTFHVYAIGGYLQKGTSIHTAEELVAADVPKYLFLVMERDVSGKDMAEAFRSALRLNHPADAFPAETAALVEFFRNGEVRKGDRVILEHVAGAGLKVNLAGRAEVLIKNVAFAKAVWEIYLGKYNLGAEIKQGLVSRL